jgi:hypothetical protein
MFLAVGTVAAGLLTPSLPIVGIPIGAWALTLATIRFGPAPAVIAAVAAGGFWLVLGGPGGGMVAAATTVALLLAAGPWALFALTRGTAGRAFWTLAVFDAVVLGLALVAEAALSHSTLTGMMAQQAGPVADAYRQAGLDVTAAQVARWATELLPGFVLVSAVIAAALTVWAVARTARGAGVPVAAVPTLAQVDVSAWGVGALAFGVAALSVARFAPVASAIAQPVGFNLLALSIPFLVVQGLGVMTWLLAAVGAGPVIRGVAVACALIVTPLPFVVYAGGLLDTWFNVRKLPRSGEEPSEPTA